MAEWQIKAAIRGDLRRAMEADILAGEKAVTSAFRRRTSALQKNTRKAISGAGLGDKLPRAIRTVFYPTRGESLRPKGIMFSKATYKRPGGTFDLITVLDEGVSVRPRSHQYMAIPLFRRPGLRGQKVQPSDFPPGTFVSTRINVRGVGFLFWADRNEAAFVLVRRARVPRHNLGIDSLRERAMSGIDALIARDWERRAAKARID